MKPSIPDKLKNLKIALVHDDLVQYGGGENVFTTIKELFPTAPIYTSLVTSEWVDRLGGRRPYTTFMQFLPLKQRLQRAYFLLYPLAFESFSFSDFDLVISSSTRFAHGIITNPKTKHICYMHSPGRMFWEPKEYFGERSKLKTAISPVLASFRLWDFATAQRVDRFLTNSNHIAEKIKKYYRREAGVIYPPVDLSRFELGMERGSYFLIVSRLLYWKRVDLAIKAALELGLPLRIVGDGPERRRLEKLGQGRVEFLGWVSGGELVNLYRECRALIMPQEEDFGIVSIEAQASGKPVISYRGGGALETVIEGRTGEFFSPQTMGALIAMLKRFRVEDYDPKECRKNSEHFTEERFQRRLIGEIVKVIGD